MTRCYDRDLSAFQVLGMSFIVIKAETATSGMCVHCGKRICAAAQLKRLVYVRYPT
jgi:hypothetical protein